MKTLISGITLALLVVGCSTNNPIGASLGVQPTPATSEYLHTKGGGFAVQLDDKRKAKSCTYSLLLTPTKRLTLALYLEARFENPAGGAPLVTEAVISPDKPDLLLVSPQVQGLRSRQVYRVDILIFDSPTKTKQLGLHTQYIQSFINL